MKGLCRNTYYKVKGIYIIRSTFDNRCYIGSSNNLYKRVNYHINELKKNKHVNSKLQRFANKYGLNCLSVDVLQLIEDDVNIFDEETKYIKLYDAYTTGFNLMEEAQPIKGKPLTETHRKKCSDGHKKNLQKNLPSLINNLEKARKVRNKNIQEAHEKGEKVDNGWTGRKHKDSSKEKMRKAKLGKPSHNKKAVNCYSKDGTVLIRTYESLTEAAMHCNAIASNIGAVCRGKRNSTAGYFWKYVKDEIK